MSIEIVPFTETHLEGAARVLATRQQRMRQAEPFLDPLLENVEATLPIVSQIMRDSQAGLAALVNGRVIGHQFWKYEETLPTQWFAPFVAARAVDVSFSGCAFEAGIPGVIRRLYATASATWVADGFASHSMQSAHVDRSVAEELNEIGFAPRITMAARETNEPFEKLTRADLEVRRAEPGEHHIAQEFATELLRCLPEAPSLLPFFAESVPDLHRYVEESFADPGCSYWFALREGKPVAMQHFVEPSSSLFHQDPMLAPSGAIYLFLAVTDPAVRGAGVNTALLAETLNWAASRGYTHCTLHYVTAGFASEYWRRHGFRPFKQWLIRDVDPRVMESTVPESG